MDRFRIMALEKLLEEKNLDINQQEAVVKKLVEKLTILMNGAKKRGKHREVIAYESLLNKHLRLSSVSRETVHNK